MSSFTEDLNRRLAGHTAPCDHCGKATTLRWLLWRVGRVHADTGDASCRLAASAKGVDDEAIIRDALAATAAQSTEAPAGDGDSGWHAAVLDEDGA